MLGIPEYLVKEISVSAVDDAKLFNIPGIHPKQCYNNAVLAGLALDAEAVVFGLIEVEGILIEHAWLKLKSGEYVDPTLQLVQDPEEVCVYYAAVGIRLDDYSLVMERMPDNNKAIDFQDLRRAGVFSAMSEILKSKQLEGIAYFAIEAGKPGFEYRQAKVASRVEAPAP